MFSIRVDDKATPAVRDAARRGVDALDAAQVRRAQDLIDRTIPKTPRRSGRLRAGFWFRRARPVEVRNDVPYAALVHEKYAVHAVGRDKFLAVAGAELANEGNAPLEAHFREAFARGETLASAPARHPESPPSAAPAAPVGRPRPTIGGRRR